MIVPDRWPAKGATEVLVYSVNWTKRLAGATILTSVFTFNTALGLEFEGVATLHDDTISTVKLKGGAPNSDGDDIAELRCTITTSDGQTMFEDIPIQVGL